MTSRYLEEEVRLTRLTRRLADALLPTDPHHRRYVFRRAGEEAVDDRDSFACAERARLGRQARKGAAA